MPALQDFDMSANLTSLPTTRAARGRSLVELMIALLIGAVVVAGVLYVSSNSTASGRRTDSLSRLNEAGQVALQFLSSDVRMAGYAHTTTLFNPGAQTTNYPLAGVRGCDAAFDNMRGGGAAATLKDLTCPGGDATTASASFAVVHEVDQFNGITVAGSEKGLPQAFADCRGFALKSDPASGLKGNTMNSYNNGEWYWLVESRYFIDTSSGTPSLMCAGNGDAPFDKGQAIIQGVERMVVTYGVGSGDANPNGSENVLVMKEGVTAFMTAAEIDAKWGGTETPQQRWQRVISMRVCLELLGDAGSAPKIANGNYGSYTNCNGTAKTITDGRQRKAVTLSINLRNRTGVPAPTGLGTGGV
jgi:type IV pilus assembly protein PilW